MATHYGTPDVEWVAGLFGRGPIDGADRAGRSGLRERKKAKTRAALIEASQRLFVEQGYRGTTLDTIAAEVDITTQTLLRYFESKAQLALDPMVAPLEEFERFLRAPDRSVDTLAAWRRYVEREAHEAVHPTTDAMATYVANMRAYRGWVDRDPGLVAKLADIEAWLRGILAAGLARDAGAEVDDLHSTLVAALLVAGRRAVWDRWLARDLGAGSLVEEQAAVVDYAVRSLPRTGAERLLAVVD